MANDNPHDKVAKNILGRQETAVSFLKAFLPEPVSRHLDIDALKFQSDSFVPDHLKSFFSDILISVPVKNRHQQAEIYVLLEHKSYPDEMVILQLLRYMVETWTSHEIKKKKTEYQKLPMLIPIVIAHGEHQWQFKKTLRSVVEVPSEDFLVYLPDFEYALFDVNVEDIRGYAFTRH